MHHGRNCALHAEGVQSAICGDPSRVFSRSVPAMGHTSQLPLKLLYPLAWGVVRSFLGPCAYEHWHLGEVGRTGSRREAFCRHPTRLLRPPLPPIDESLHVMGLYWARHTGRRGGGGGVATRASGEPVGLDGGVVMPMTSVPTYGTPFVFATWHKTAGRKFFASLLSKLVAFQIAESFMFPLPHLLSLVFALQRRLLGSSRPAMRPRPRSRSSGGTWIVTSRTPRSPYTPHPIPCS